MATQPRGTPSRRETGARRGRLLIEDAAGSRPFMRGILVHSLMARGLSFEEAYDAANQVRDRLREQGVVTRAELARTVVELLGDRVRGHAPSRAGIQVTRRGRGTAFSKGFLSQSLLAAAIDPNDAFDVARQIELELLKRGVREIDRRELRRLAYETLEGRLGPETAERYLVWRAFEQPDHPVILLLGGTAGAGKTALALEVGHRLGIHRVISTDAIRQVMRIMLSPELMPAIHASSYDAHKALGATGPDAVIEGFLAQASVVSVGVGAMMDRAVAENASLILDGVSIVPGLLDLDAWRESAHVIFLLVATLDVDAFRTRFQQRARDEERRPPHRYLENLDAILQVQDHLLELAEQHDVPIVDNESFDLSVLSIIRHVTGTLRKSRGFDAAELL